MENSALIEMIAQNEGFRPSIYKDTKGKRTVGYGFNIDDPVTREYIPRTVLMGLRSMSEKEAKEVLIRRLPIAIRDAQNFVGVDNFSKLTPARQHVLIDMAYQMGAGGLNGFKNTREALQTGNYNMASDEILDSDYARSDSPNRAYRNAYSMLVAQPYDAQAVTAFQRSNGLKTDGIVGPSTYTLLRKRMEKK